MSSRFCLTVFFVGLTLLVCACSCIADESVSSPESRVALAETPYGYEVTLDGKLFAGYRRNFNGTPIIWPVIGPNEKPMTRAYPMSDDVSDEKKDHPHHRSIWFTHDDINGNKHWGGGSDIEHQEFLKAECDGKTAIIVTKNHWLDKQTKNTICSDIRTITFGAVNSHRFIDFDVVLTAEQDKVTISDTKEGTFA
ncbi:MAG: PmoA family protein, partial [Planctomycetaceae bacterium]|nr:PmoA family protein [Planctomycetaceae bacterium]